MTREMCEKLIANQLRNIIELYKIYNPDGEYLTLCYNKNSISFNNAYWKAVDGSEPGEDVNTPIDYREVFDKEIEEDEE